MKHKKWKASSTVSKISQLKTPKTLQSSAHKQKNWKKLQKDAEKESREFCLHLLGLREAAPTTNNAKYFTRHFELKWLMR